MRPEHEANDSALREYHSRQGSADNLEEFLTRCSERIRVALVKTHFELLIGMQLPRTEVLSGWVVHPF